MKSSGLHIDWCDYSAARYAVEHWHYSRCMPRGKIAKLGVWEDGQFIGCLLFGTGSGHATDGRRFGLAENFELTELVRVALKEHKAPVTKIVAIAIRMIKATFPGLRMIVSYADPVHGHVGAIYQAGNWIYSGDSAPGVAYRDNFGKYGPRGKLYHSRVCSLDGWVKTFRWAKCPKKQDLELVRLPGKHRYLYPLDDDIRKVVLPLAKAYPKRAGSIALNASGHQPEYGGSNPTPALQTSTART